MRISLRAVLIALVGLVAIGGLFTSGVLSTVSETNAGDQTKAFGFCNSNGVSLVIDYGSANSADLAINCGENFSGTGWELFAATEQKVEGTTEYPVGFVCRINDFPTVAEQSCSSTPDSTQGSWAYYYATAQLGNNWLFSATGASTRKPKCGDVDAWVFIKSGEKTREPAVTPVTFQCPK